VSRIAPTVCRISPLRASGQRPERVVQAKGGVLKNALGERWKGSFSCDARPLIHNAPSGLEKLRQFMSAPATSHPSVPGPGPRLTQCYELLAMFMSRTLRSCFRTLWH
jgi:hypothetical protein